MTRYAFGQGAFGVNEFGDGGGAVRSKVSAAVQVAYTIIPPGGNGVAVTYQVQPSGAAAVPIVYWVGASIEDFSINGSLVPKPHHVTYDLPAIVAPDLSGVSIRQGYGKVTWEYELLLDDALSLLMAQYDPNNPQVTITYLNEFGMWTQKQAMMQPPVLGQRTTIQHAGVQLVFTHIASD